MKFYHNVASQAVVVSLFQIVMLINFRLTSFSLLGSFIVSYAFCALWGNIGYMVFSVILFSILTPWIFSVGNFASWIHMYSIYLLVTFIPGIVIIYVRNSVIRRA